MKIINREDLIQKPEACRSHVVLLGAGASRAAFPKGDASGKILPVMNDLVDILDLKPLLKNAGVELSGNFETIYSDLKNNALKKEIEKEVFSYFGTLSLPTTATIYDQLLLSLCKKDAIFTFNWDPFLFDAFVRNKGIASLPRIFFLHGNVRIGSCKTHPDKWGKQAELCPTCNQKFVDVPLLYPIEKKKYFNGNNYTASSWEEAEFEFANAFTATIFGYSAPDSDMEAVKLLRNAWLSKSNRKLEHLQIIDILDSEVLVERWKGFAPTLHLSPKSSFEQSRLWLCPRRSCEALFYPMSQGSLYENFPLPETNNLNELQDAIKGIAKHE